MSLERAVYSKHIPGRKKSGQLYGLESQAMVPARLAGAAADRVSWRLG